MIAIVEEKSVAAEPESIPVLLMILSVIWNSRSSRIHSTWTPTSNTEEEVCFEEVVEETLWSQRGDSAGNRIDYGFDRRNTKTRKEVVGIVVVIEKSVTTVPEKKIECSTHDGEDNRNRSGYISPSNIIENITRDV